MSDLTRCVLFFFGVGCVALVPFLLAEAAKRWWDALLPTDEKAFVAARIDKDVAALEAAKKAPSPSALRVRDLEKEIAWLREENQRLRDEQGYR